MLRTCAFIFGSSFNRGRSHGCISSFVFSLGSVVTGAHKMSNNDSWGSSVWGYNENWNDGNSWAGSETWNTDNWMTADVVGALTTWTAALESRKREEWKNKLVYEASWMVQGSVYDFNKHADLWRGRDADGYLPNPKDETDSMFVHADDEQDDLRSRGSKQQAADDEQDDLRSRGSKQASIGSADGITAISMHLPASFQFRPDPGIEVPEHAIMTLQYFQALKAYCSWKLHNHALKMFRDYYERDSGANLGGGWIEYPLSPDLNLRITFLQFSMPRGNILTIGETRRVGIGIRWWPNWMRIRWNSLYKGMGKKRDAVADLWLAASCKIIGTITNDHVRAPLIAFGITYCIALMEAASLCTPSTVKQSLRAQLGCLFQTSTFLRADTICQ